jgi:3-deoxy-D-manno-octulosonic-acid transferase
MFILSKIYSAVTFLLSLVVAPFFVLNQRGRLRILDRFGIWLLPAGEVVWLHGASVGEVNGLLAVMNKIKETNSSVPILLTTTSTTGLMLGAPYCDHARLLTFDSSVWLKIALKNVKPRALIISETEIWPALILEMKRRNVPVYFVNGRISDYSFKRYRLLRFVFNIILKNVSLVLAADKKSLERFSSLGVAPEKLKLVGNAKYDMRPSIPDKNAATALKAAFFANLSPVLVLGSIRPGEEVPWLAAISRAREQGLRFNLILAPRHREKDDYFREKEANILFKNWSDMKRATSVDTVTNTVLLDTMGALEQVYSFADVSFVGGTIENWGGHNILEPAMYASCIVVGPNVQNVREVFAEMERQRAILTVNSADEMFDVIKKMCMKDATFTLMGEKAREVWRVNSGTSDKILKAIVHECPNLLATPERE